MTENTNPTENTLLTLKLYARSVAWTTNIRTPWGEVLAVISALLVTPPIAVVCACESVVLYGEVLQKLAGK